MRQKGFTIAELLIVIIVIAILAAIAIATYNGIQSRAYDAAIRSDFHHVKNLLDMYRAEHGSYPHDTASNSDCSQSNASTVIRAALSSVEMKLSTHAYDTSANANLLYLASNDGERFALLGFAKGNPSYVITNEMSTAETYISNPSVSASRFPGGATCHIADNLGISSASTHADHGFYYIFVGGAGGFRIWK